MTYCVKREEGAQAALSENITMILEDLLNNYDKTERPSFKHGEFLILQLLLLVFIECEEIRST